MLGIPNFGNLKFCRCWRGSVANVYSTKAMQARSQFSAHSMSTCIDDDNQNNTGNAPALIEDNGQFYGVYYLPMTPIVRMASQIPLNIVWEIVD